MRGTFNPAKDAEKRAMRAQTVEGQIQACPASAVAAGKRLVEKWERLTRKSWEKREEKS
jgi:hypothetical protein